jgi:hypothetical protein
MEQTSMAVSSKEGYGSKRVVLPMMMMIKRVLGALSSG